MTIEINLGHAMTRILPLRNEDYIQLAGRFDQASTINTGWDSTLTLRQPTSSYYATKESIN